MRITRTDLKQWHRFFAVFPVNYVMCRFGDAGAYEVGNVYIAHASDNKRDAWFNNRVSLPNTGLFYKDIS